jgi:hypothetical protein
MKTVMIAVIGLALCAGCVTTKMDPKTQALVAMRMEAEKQTQDKETRVTIEVQTNDKKIHPIEVIKDPSGRFIIPTDKIVVRYELKVD